MKCQECNRRIWFFQRKIRFRKPLCPEEAFHLKCYNRYLDKVVYAKSKTVREVAKKLGIPCYDFPLKKIN